MLKISGTPSFPIFNGCQRVVCASIFYLGKRFNSNRSSKKTRQGAIHLFPSERAAFCESGLSAGRLAQDGRTAGADDDGLGVGEDGGDGEATGALDVHEKGSWAGHECLELVLSGLSLRCWVEEIEGENHCECC